MSYRIISLRAGKSDNDWVGAVAAEAVLQVEGKRKPVYVSLGWLDAAAEEPEFLITRESVYDFYTYEKETESEFKKIMRSKTSFASYKEAYGSEYGNVFKILAKMVKEILNSDGYSKKKLPWFIK